jgi:hypothetical protein
MIKNREPFIWLCIAVYFMSGSVSIYGMNLAGRQQTSRRTKTPTPRPTPTVQPPTRQPLAIMPPPSTEEITPQPAPVNIRLSPQKQALKEIMEDFSGKFGSLIAPSNKQALDDIITGRMRLTPPGTALLPEMAPLSPEQIQELRALKFQQEQQRQQQQREALKGLSGTL